ncbi:MAG: hypothetical protein V3S55_03930 [Nitrospiraceae bacterium]
MSTITDLARELATLKAQKKHLEDRVKTCNKQIMAIAVGKLPELMSELDIPKFTVDGVGTIYLQDKLEISVLADDRPETYAWLRDNGHKALIVDYVWPRTMNAWAKEQLNTGQELPETMKATFIPTAMVRKS